MDFFLQYVVDTAQCRVETCSFCLHTSMELNLIPNSSLLYLHSNDNEQLKKCILEGKKSYNYEYHCYKNNNPQINTR